MHVYRRRITGNRPIKRPSALEMSIRETAKNLRPKKKLKPLKNRYAPGEGRPKISGRIHRDKSGKTQKTLW